MEKMLTDEEIVKALQCCDSEEVDCKNCPYHKKKMLCFYTRCSDTLDFIRRLQQRVSILEADNDDYKMKIAENELVSIDWHNEQVEHLEEENAELQKQVDELKVEMHKIESLANETYMLAFEEGSQKAVKDTAKEIFETIFYDCWAIKDENGHKIFDEGKMKDFAKKCYGVEVE